MPNNGENSGHRLDALKTQYHLQRVNNRDPPPASQIGVMPECSDAKLKRLAELTINPHALPLHHPRLALAHGAGGDGLWRGG